MEACFKQRRCARRPVCPRSTSTWPVVSSLDGYNIRKFRDFVQCLIEKRNFGNMVQDLLMERVARIPFEMNDKNLNCSSMAIYATNPSMLQEKSFLNIFSLFLKLLFSLNKQLKFVVYVSKFSIKMPKVRQFSVHEVENNGKISISIVFDEIVTHITTDIGSNLVKIERSGNSEKSETGDIHQIASNICNEFIENGILESKLFQIDCTKIPVPSNLQKIHCNQFSSAFLGDQKVIRWLEKLDGTVEILKLTENGVIKGLGKMEQLKNVTKELIAVGCDISDEELENLRKDYCSLVLNSEKLTEKGVKRALENYLEQPQKSGNVFDIRFKASSANFDKNDLFKGLMKAEITWKQYFSFKISYSLNSGAILEYDGFYFNLKNGLHSVKIMIPMDWKPRLRDGNTL
ncbi:hypothetical protein B9Z55_000562 [Caenorhabditis nigoni]|nr:hypothetical protein B9Z55_000562 [Caenorhabditis nigoni]